MGQLIHNIYMVYKPKAHAEASAVFHFSLFYKNIGLHNVNFTGYILLTKSLSCNVAAIIGMP
jgi:hypothetical protein